MNLVLLGCDLKGGCLLLKLINSNLPLEKLNLLLALGKLRTASTLIASALETIRKGVRGRLRKTMEVVF